MAAKSTLETEAQREAQFGVLPVLPHERVWGFWDFTWVNVGLAIATWAFLIGGSMSVFTGVKAGIAAAVIGNAISVGLMALSTCPPSGKWGLEQYTALRSVLGRHGVKVIVIVWLVAIEIGWAAVLSIMFGRSSTNVVNELAGRDFGPNSLVVTGFAIVAIVIAWLILAKGPVSIKWFNTVVAPGLFIIQIVMVVLIFTEKSWGEMTAIPPLEPFGNKLLDFMVVLEFNLAAGFSWWPVMGSLARVTKTKRAAFWPNMIGLFAAAVIGEAVGLMAGLALGDSDPTVWMIPLGGTALGVLALVWIAFANITSIVSIIYSTCLALKQVGGNALSRVSWATLTGAFFVVPLLLTLRPSLIYDNFFQFLYWSGVAYAPLSAIYIADYYLLRRQRLDLRAIYDTRPEAPYSFWRGVNPAALIALAAGSGTYILLLNPATLEQYVPGFQYLSASLPAFVVAGVVYLVLTRLWVAPAGKGGYAA
jgi:NCS1 family nucleobase:cation symporter-1